MDANKEKREKYFKEINKLSSETLVYLDESGIDMTACKDRGWSKIGQKLMGKKSGKHYQRTNITAFCSDNISSLVMLSTHG